MKKNLKNLLNELGIEHSLNKDVFISGIKLDSRKVERGDLFFAFEGIADDRHRFIPNAIENGAAAVMGTKEGLVFEVPYIQIEDPRAILGQFSAAFYDYPAKKLHLTGVTGTDGKTTTINILYHILKEAGLSVGMISTVNANIGDEILDTGFHVTTPEAMDVQHYLNLMVEAGMDYALLETTSHGLAMLRVNPEEFDLGVVTNITHEHLDYHGSYEQYQKDKGRLFVGLGEPYDKEYERVAVLNKDDGSFDYLNEITMTKKICYSLFDDGDLVAKHVKFSPKGMMFLMCGDGFELNVDCPMIGNFNVSNVLAASSAAMYGFGVSPEDVKKHLETFEGVPGRMELIDLGQDFTAIVDFAHTPNGLKEALEALRMQTDKKIYAVFGSAGLRDKEKRRMMAEIAAELADVSILTAEDPRIESLDGILQEMADGALSKGGVEEETFWCVRDRGDAIRKAIELAKPGELVVAFGKGHEQSMCFGETEYLWDDRIAMRAALAEHLGIEGEKMPVLPTQDENFLS